jgi:UDP-N-acetylmuramoylalanine-D-glutamate ligase
MESLDDKIIKLLNTKLLIPITEDFLLYHKDNESYEKNTYDINKKKKEDTKIKYIINKIDTFSEYYTTEDQNKKQSIGKGESD